MSHLHRMRAANLAIAGDCDNKHPCTPTITVDELALVTVGELANGHPDELVPVVAPAAAARAARDGRPVAKKAGKRAKRIGSKR